MDSPSTAEIRRRRHRLRGELGCGFTGAADELEWLENELRAVNHPAVRPLETAGASLALVLSPRSHRARSPH